MEKSLKQYTEDAIWVAKTLFDRNKATGSSANLSFRYEDKIYITGSGTCFGRLKADDFAVMDIEGRLLSENKPSKEGPLHLMMYKKDDAIGAVVHTHSIYSVLWSFQEFENEYDIIPAHTPYLKMKLGSVGLIPYETPGSKELFDAFKDRAAKSDGFLLKQHGPVVPGKDVLDAFYCLEELEESAQIALKLRADMK